MTQHKKASLGTQATTAGETFQKKIEGPCLALGVDAYSCGLSASSWFLEVFSSVYQVSACLQRAGVRASGSYELSSFKRGSSQVPGLLLTSSGWPSFAYGFLAFTASRDWCHADGQPQEDPYSVIPIAMSIF